MLPRIPLLICLAAAFGFAGCEGCAPATSLDAGVEPGGGLDAGDGGAPPARDAGSRDAGVTTPDSGVPFRQGYADEPCPEGSAAFAPDGGFPEGTTTRGLCIALTTLTGTALIDGLPAVDGAQLKFDGIEYFSDLDAPVDGAGNYLARVMRGRYDRLLFHPAALVDHAGPKDFGVIDLRKDQLRDLAVQTWIVEGATFFAGQPWPSTVQPPDTTIHCDGLVAQRAWTTNVGGSYSVRLIEGAFAYNVSVPRETLGETELIEYPVSPLVDLKADTTVDINIPTSELSGTFTVDGAPFPDRLPNAPEFRLSYVPSGKNDAVAQTVHQGGAAFYSAVVPKGTYSINLNLTDAADPRLPAQLFDKQLAINVDLSLNRQLNFDLQTHRVEGALLVDGVPVSPNAAYSWNLYAASANIGTQPGFISYYRVPLTGSSFDLRALPGRYTMYLYLDGNLSPGLGEGWFLVRSGMDVFGDVSLPLDIPTEVVEGSLLIDGVPAASQTGSVGTLVFEGPRGYFRHRLTTTDGSFHLRLPKMEYRVHFEINPDAYPDYARGLQFLNATLNLEAPVGPVTLAYDTVPVGGALLFAGGLLPDALSTQPEATLLLRTTTGWVTFRKKLEGGQPWYFMRIPKNDYKLTFELAKDVFEGVAHGTAPLGNNLLLKTP